MKKFLKPIINNPLFSGSLVMILGSNATNFINYVFNLVIGRLLGPAQYGELAALLSLISLYAMIPFSLGLVIIKFISSSKTKEEVSGTIHWFSKITLSLTI